MLSFITIAVIMNTVLALTACIGDLRLTIIVNTKWRLMTRSHGLKLWLNIRIKLMKIMLIRHGSVVLGRAKLINEIAKRLDMINIDRVALAMSSHRCENYFSVLVKFTCGKRIYFGRKDGWKVRCLYVAASITNKRLTDSIQKGLGVLSSSYVREL